MNLAGWFVSYMARWLPHAASTGLSAVGNPGRNSPVLVTANFSLTVRHVRRALAGLDAWLLVVNTGGINVWCAAAGRIFTEQRVIDALKITGLSDRIDHRELILPALCAPGVDLAAIHAASGFHARFGPVYADDIREYLGADCKKTDAMRRFRFDLRHRLEMVMPMNAPAYLLLAVAAALFAPRILPGLTLLFWSAVLMLYLLTPWIPGRTGWAQALLTATVVVLGWCAWDAWYYGHPCLHAGWYAAAFAVFLLVGFDLAGIATPRKSDPAMLLSRLGVKRLGALFSEHEMGTIRLRRERCIGCGKCRDICPIGVYGKPDPDGKTTFRTRDACFNCGACVKQCPAGALTIGRRH